MSTLIIQNNKLSEIPYIYIASASHMFTHAYIWHTDALYLFIEFHEHARNIDKIS